MLSTERTGVSISTPVSPDWDDARRAWNLTADQRPAAVAHPASAAEVQVVVDAARAEGLGVAAQCTGHGACALGPLDDVVLVRTNRLRGVAIDPVGHRARCGAGNVWEEVTVPAAAHGLAALAGSAPDVGVVGFTLGGGIGWLSRRHGLACNQVASFEVVLADGRLMRCDPRTDRDLFWALRGGGGSFGIVTAMTFDLLPVATAFAGALMWPAERAGEVLHAWRDWTRDVSDDVTSIGRILRVPDLPHVPAPMRGRALVVVELCDLGDDPAAVVAPLRALRPEIDTCAVVPVPALQAVHGDPPVPVPGLSDTALLDALPAEAIDAFVDAVGPGSGSTLTAADLRHLGGALASAPPNAGATASIDAPYAAFAVGPGLPMEDGSATAASLSRLRAALAPFEAPRSALNFVDRPCDTKAMFRPSAYMLLQQIKTRVDPQEMIRANHPIPPL